MRCEELEAFLVLVLVVVVMGVCGWYENDIPESEITTQAHRDAAALP